MAEAMAPETFDNPFQLMGIALVFSSVRSMNRFVTGAHAEAKTRSIQKIEPLLRHLFKIIENMPESLGQPLPGSTERSMEIADRLSELYRLWTRSVGPDYDGAIEEVRYGIHHTLIGAAGDPTVNISSSQRAQFLDDTMTLKTSLWLIRRDLGFLFAERQLLLKPVTLPSNRRSFVRPFARSEWEALFSAFHQSSSSVSALPEIDIADARSSQLPSTVSHPEVVRRTQGGRIEFNPLQPVSDAASNASPSQRQTSASLARLRTKYIKPCYILILLGFLTIVGSLVPALWRSVDQSDISGGFAMAQYTLGVGAFTIGCIVAIHSRMCTCWSHLDSLSD